MLRAYVLVEAVEEARELNENFQSFSSRNHETVCLVPTPVLFHVVLLFSLFLSYVSQELPNVASIQGQVVSIKPPAARKNLSFSILQIKDEYLRIPPRS